MKKYIKLLIACCFFILTLTNNAFAQDSPEIRKTNFQETMSIYYNNKKETIVTGINGNDITEEFFAVTSPYYQSGNYEMFQKYFHENVGRIYYQKEEIISRQRMGITKVVTGYESRVLVDQNGHTAEVMIYVGGTIVYDPNTGYILSAYNPKLIRTDYMSNESSWSFEDKSISTSSSISKDKFTAYFTVKYNCIGRYDISPVIYNFGWPEVTISTQAGA